MDSPSEQVLRRAISTIAQVDPLIKLLQEVRAGRLKPTDAGLRAVTESWIETYERVLTLEGLTRSGLRRLDPAPRVAVLVEFGVLDLDHQAVRRLSAAFHRAMAASTA
ncbi:MAG: hypothetical protein NNA20_12940 [Nitrospira sp.]|nr:hypothetical protein [Nitrospira sp.]MCP9443478.1 hypothetical protein [Nitrospira sp.]